MAPAVLLALLAAGAVFFGSCLGTRLLIATLRRRQMLDVPNERSLHTMPVPRGGGIAVVGTIVAAWAGLSVVGLPARADLLASAAAMGLAIVSWIDDRNGLSPVPRLAAQFVAVAVTLVMLPGALFQGWLPPALDAVATALLWVWFINLYNFMDGVDGIAGSEAVAIGLGLMLVASSGRAFDLDIAFPAAAIVLAALGFLVWNWAPARIILGDVGSIPLGFLLGFLLRELALRGMWKPALILPLYFLADATLTLLRRLARGERVWRPHREHFYQRAVQRGLRHDAVVLRVIAADIVLIGCAWAAENISGFAGFAVAILTVALLLVALGRGTQRA